MTDSVEITANEVATLPRSDVAVPQARMGDFTTGTDGRTNRVWERSGIGGPMGWGWNALTATPYAIGSRTAREAPLASAVSNDLSTRNALVATIVEVIIANTLGPAGLTLSSRPNAKMLGLTAEQARDLSGQFEGAWNAWANNPRECDLAGRNDVTSLCTTFVRHCILDGEGLVGFDWQRCGDARTCTKIALYDPRQLDITQTKTLDQGAHAIQGVVFDRRGRLAGYMIREIPLGSLTISPASRFVKAATTWGRLSILHCFEQLDAKQIRGLSPIVGSLTPAHSHASLSEFTIVNSLIQTQYCVTIESDGSNSEVQNAMGDDTLPAAALDGRGSAPVSSFQNWLNNSVDYYNKIDIKMQPGAITHLLPNDKLKMNHAQSAGDIFAPFDKALIKRAARAAGCNVEDVSGDYSEVNYSVSRMSQEVPYRTMLRRRRIYAERFYQETYRAICDEFVDKGMVRLPDGAPDYWNNRDHYTGARWWGIGRAEPDRKKAAEADALEMENMTSTLEQKLAERGIDLDQHVDNLVAERKILRDAGLDKPFYPGQTTTQNRIETIDEEETSKQGTR